MHYNTLFKYNMKQGKTWNLMLQVISKAALIYESVGSYRFFVCLFCQDNIELYFSTSDDFWEILSTLKGPNKPLVFSINVWFMNCGDAQCHGCMCFYYWCVPYNNVTGSCCHVNVYICSYSGHRDHVPAYWRKMHVSEEWHSSYFWTCLFFHLNLSLTLCHLPQ